MRTRIPLLVMTGSLALMSACGPGDETDSRDAGVELRDGHVVELPDSLSFTTADRNGDGVIGQVELRVWMEDRSAFAPDAPETDLAAALDTAGPSPQTVWREDLDLTLSETEWLNGGRYLYTRAAEPGLFAEWDTDGDLRLDPLEALAGLDVRGENEPMETGSITTREQLAEVLFRLWDIDGNGTLESDEYRGGIAIWWM
ncbi:MAG: hypothetical protein U5R14_07620 [Gemmatimonadota bacterium]|nr:hypothetical protein [Gemmatimonadota bacterium]